MFACAGHVSYREKAVRFLLILAGVLYGIAGEAHTAWSQVESPMRTLASSLPGSIAPEFVADILIQLATSSEAARETRDWRKEQLETAFNLAASAQEPIAVMRALTTPTDTRAGMTANGSKYGLDRTSLRVRALKGMYTLDPARAIALSNDVLEVTAPTMTCDDLLAPDPSVVYDWAVTISKDPTGRRFLRRLISSIRSSTEIGPAFKAIAASGFNEEQARDALQSLAGTLRNLRDDDVSFSISFARNWSAVRRMVDTSNESSFTSWLLESYRAYLVNHLTGERCRPTSASPSDTASDQKRLVPEINRVLVAHGLSELSDREQVPGRVTPSAPDVLYWQTPMPRALLADLGVIQRANGHTPKESVAWSSLVGGYIVKLNKWSPRDEASDTDYFNQRCILTNQLINVLAPGDQRDAVLDDEITFLAAQSGGILTQPSWSWHFRRLLERHSGGDDRSWILSRLDRSGHPVMQAYAAAQRFLPTKR